MLFCLLLLSVFSSQALAQGPWGPAGLGWQGNGNGTVSIPNNLCGQSVQAVETTPTAASLTIMQLHADDNSDSDDDMSKNTYFSFQLVPTDSSIIAGVSHFANETLPINGGTPVVSFYNTTVTSNKDGSRIINATLVNDASQLWASEGALIDPTPGLWIVDGYTESCSNGGADQRDYFLQNGTVITIETSSSDDLNGQATLTIKGAPMWCGACKEGQGPFLNVATVDMVMNVGSSGGFSGTPTLGLKSTPTSKPSSGSSSNGSMGIMSTFSGWFVGMLIGIVFCW